MKEYDQAISEKMVGMLAMLEMKTKAERTKAGMVKALKEGYWQWTPPFGYRVEKRAEGRNVVRPNNDAALVKRAFDLYKTGLHSKVEVFRVLKEEGFTGGRPGRIARILSNPFYIGKIEHSWLDGAVEGKHKAIISEGDFLKVQELLIKKLS